MRIRFKLDIINQPILTVHSAILAEYNSYSFIRDSDLVLKSSLNLSLCQKEIRFFFALL